ncbi:MAG: hypothetical protein ABSA31_00310 [Acidimicrobiales bacterium]|jgi:hypothetical protein
MKNIIFSCRTLQAAEHRFRPLKDFLALRPVCHRFEHRVRGHIALRVIAAAIEAVMGDNLERAGVRDPDLPEHRKTGSSQ